MSINAIIRFLGRITRSVRDLLKWLMKPSRALLVLFFSGVFGLAIAEGIVRIAGFDWRFIGKLLGYQMGDFESHEPDPDPEILFRLKPGTVQYHNKKIVISSLGARSPERSAIKPPGIFRIVCLGGSNVYGAEVENDQTWPEQLERQLNSAAPGWFEVWNYGTSAYVPVQMAAVGRRAVEKLNPDLVIFGFSNTGPRLWLKGSPIGGYFKRDPGLWPLIFRPECLPQPSFLSYEHRLGLLRRFALYRLAAAYYRPFDNCRWAGGLNREHDALNVKASRGFLKWVKDRGIGICVFLYPGDWEHPVFEPYYEGIDVPVIRLSGENLPEEYLKMHPPPEGLKWYGERIAEALRKLNLVPH